MSFFKKIQGCFLKCKKISERILRFFTRPVNARSLGSWCVKGTEESTLEVDYLVPLTHHDQKDLALICLRILSDLKIQSQSFLKKRTLSRVPVSKYGLNGNVPAGHYNCDGFVFISFVFPHFTMLLLYFITFIG